MSPAEIKEVAWLLMLIPFGIVFSSGAAFFFCAWRRASARVQMPMTRHSTTSTTESFRSSPFEQPNRWLAVKAKAASRDRVQQGRRYILLGTLLARGLLCWAMSGAVSGDPITLFPAAFGVLVLQKAYSITRSSVTPRLLPSSLSLVTANARNGLAATIASTIAAPAAFGIQHYIGAAWVLRIGTLVYLGATVLGTRVPDHVDETVTVVASINLAPMRKLTV